MDRFSAHIDRAWDLISKGNGYQALLAARQALGIDSESAEVHNLLGCIYAMDGDFSEALTCYRRAMDLDDEYLDPLLNAAELLLHSEDDADEAIRYCAIARSMACVDEELVEVVLLEVDALLNKGRFDDARSKLLEIKEKTDLSPVQNMLVGRSFLEIGDLEASRRFIDRALEQDPESGDVQYCHGLLLREEGLRVDAVFAFMSTLNSDRKVPALGWISKIGDVEKIGEQAISKLDARTRGMLSKTRIISALLPDDEQVRLEMDPRQVVFAEGVNLEHGCFERLWIFVKNFEHARISPFSVVDDLAEVIQGEVYSQKGPF